MVPDVEDGRPTAKQNARLDSHRPSDRTLASGMLERTTGPPGKAKAPALQPGPRRPSVVPRQVGPIISNRDDHRRRQVRRLAAIALTRALYGLRADARLVPPRPECCPRTCPYCAGVG